MHYLQSELYQLVREDSHIFQFLQEGSLDGIWYWDLKKPEEEWMSARFWETFGYDPESMPHRADAWQDIINQDDLSNALENFHAHCADPNHPYDQVVRYRHKDGSTVSVRCRGIAIRDENGTPIRMLGAHTDLTELKRTEEALRNANIMLETERDRAQAISDSKSAFLANMSHEIRTPLNGVLGMAGALSMTSLNPQQHNMLAVLTRSGEQLLVLLNDLLDLSRIETGEISLDMERFEPNALISDISELFAERAKDNKVKLTVELAPSARCSLIGAAPRIKQVVTNLVSNAVKFAEASSVVIRVAVENGADPETSRLVVSVADTGRGVQAQDKESIFDRYSQGAQSEALAKAGAGLGLSIARTLCALHGGELTLDDTRGAARPSPPALPPAALQ